MRSNSTHLAWWDLRRRASLGFLTPRDEGGMSPLGPPTTGLILATVLYAFMFFVILHPHNNAMSQIFNPGLLEEARKVLKMLTIVNIFNFSSQLCVGSPRGTSVLSGMTWSPFASSSRSLGGALWQRGLGSLEAGPTGAPAVSRGHVEDTSILCHSMVSCHFWTHWTMICHQLRHTLKCGHLLSQNVYSSEKFFHSISLVSEYEWVPGSGGEHDLSDRHCMNVPSLLALLLCSGTTLRCLSALSLWQLRPS